MKYCLTLFTAALLIGAGCTPKLSYPHLDAGANYLMSALENASSSGKFFYIHQDDIVYGHEWKVEDIVGDALERSDVKSVCGAYPSGVGFDLGGIEIASEANLDGVSFSLMRRAAVTHYERGGLVTFSWHPRNPCTGGDAWDVSSDKVVLSLLPGGENAYVFLKWLDYVADFLSSLKDSRGNVIPVIFRPWHEHLGTWFWWGSDCCTETQYRQLYTMTHDYLVNERGLRNIVWAYSPNSNFSEETFFSRYPGDEFVDIIGVDHYTYMSPDSSIDKAQRLTAAKEFYIDVMRNDMSILEKISAEHGKPFALCETGFESIPDPAWWTGTLLEGLKDIPVCYVLTWRNAWDKPGHYFAPFTGSADAEDFRAFYSDERTVFLCY